MRQIGPEADIRPDCRSPSARPIVPCSLCATSIGPEAITGVGGKLLSLLKRIAPGMKGAAAMFNPDTAPGRGLYYLGSFEAAAHSLAIEPLTAEVRSDADI